MDYAYKRVAPREFAQTLIDVERSVKRCGFVVEHSYDIGAALAAKGFPIRPLMIYEVAPAEAVDDPVTLIMPCRINVFEEDGTVTVSALRPSVFVAVFPEHDLAEIAMAYEGRIIDIVDGAVGPSPG